MSLLLRVLTSGDDAPSLPVTNRNIREYETAVRLTRDAGKEEFVDCRLTMAEVDGNAKNISAGEFSAVAGRTDCLSGRSPLP